MKNEIKTLISSSTGKHTGQYKIKTTSSEVGQIGEMGRMGWSYSRIWRYHIEVGFIARADEHDKRCIWLPMVYCQVSW